MDERQMFTYFSEFSALMTLARAHNLEQPLIQSYKKKAESKDYLGEILPFAG
jgi:hypothetical protein